jgi:hypothetical protein
MQRPSSARVALAWTTTPPWLTLMAYTSRGGCGVMREQRVVTPDGHVWHVRRRRAKRQGPWKRQVSYELSPVERDTVPVLPYTDDLMDSFGRLINFDVELGLLVVVALLALAALAVGALVVVTGAWVVPFLVSNAHLVAAVLAAIVAVLLLDRLTRPWFIEAESARLVDAPRRIWRVKGWWRARRAVRTLVAAIADGRIGAEHGIVVFD